MAHGSSSQCRRAEDIEISNAQLSDIASLIGESCISRSFAPYLVRLLGSLTDFVYRPYRRITVVIMFRGKVDNGGEYRIRLASCLITTHHCSRVLFDLILLLLISLRRKRSRRWWFQPRDRKRHKSEGEGGKTTALSLHSCHRIRPYNWLKETVIPSLSICKMKSANRFSVAVLLHLLRLSADSTMGLR